MMATKPISPKEAMKSAATTIPDVIFVVFNTLISDRVCGKQAFTITQPEVLKMITDRVPELSHTEIFKRGWLDIEAHYEKAGWTVTYDKPGYNETYEASWCFKP